MAQHRLVAAMLLTPGDTLLTPSSLPVLLISVERMGRQVDMRCCNAYLTTIQRIGYDAYVDTPTLVVEHT